MTKSLTEQQIRKIIENVTGKAAKVCEQKFYGNPKSLTEQWKDGTLEQKYYYVKFDCKPRPFVEIELKNFLLDLVKVKDRDNIEVLAPVPDFDEYKELVSKADKLNKIMCDTQTNTLDCMQIEIDGLNIYIERLEKQLEISKKALKEYMKCENGSYARKALSLIEEVK